MPVAQIMRELIAENRGSVIAGSKTKLRHTPKVKGDRRMQLARLPELTRLCRSCCAVEGRQATGREPGTGCLPTGSRQAADLPADQHGRRATADRASLLARNLDLIGSFSRSARNGRAQRHAVA